MPHNSTTQIGVSYREIEGHPGYRVGDDGSVWSLWRRTGLPGRQGITTIMGDEWRQLSAKPDWSGYPMVHLGCKSKVIRVHRLVLEVFVGPCPPGKECGHLNGIKTDCRLVNLRWGTHRENTAAALRHGRIRRGERAVRARFTEHDVRDMRMRHAAGESLGSIARAYKVHQTHVSKICHRKIWAHVT
jgi:hypothetical protein